MRIAVFSTKPYDRRFLESANADHGHELLFLEPRLNETTVSLAAGAPAVCAFVNDVLSADVLRQLHAGGTRLIALRCAGFNNVDLETADALGFTIARVPAYSPYAVAEHTAALILALNRKTHRAFNRVREGNFAIDGLLGFDLNGRTAGVVGTGRIGQVVTKIMIGFGCRVLAFDPYPNDDIRQMGAWYVELDDLLRDSDIVTLHCPLTPESKHLINTDSIRRMKDGAMLINTSRGSLVDTKALVAGLKTGKLGAVGLDVYEEEADVFFEDLSDRILLDDVLARLLTFSNVIITSHQAFFTSDAMSRIAETTLGNISAFDRGGVAAENVVRPQA